MYIYIYETSYGKADNFWWVVVRLLYRRICYKTLISEVTLFHIE